MSFCHLYVLFYPPFKRTTGRAANTTGTTTSCDTGWYIGEYECGLCKDKAASVKCPLWECTQHSKLTDFREGETVTEKATIEREKELAGVYPCRWKCFLRYSRQCGQQYGCQHPTYLQVCRHRTDFVECGRRHQYSFWKAVRPPGRNQAPANPGGYCRVKKTGSIRNP